MGGWAQGQDKGEGELDLTPIQVSDQQAHGEPVALLLPGKGDNVQKKQTHQGLSPKDNLLHMTPSSRDSPALPGPAA